MSNTMTNTVQAQLVETYVVWLYLDLVARPQLSLNGHPGMLVQWRRRALSSLTIFHKVDINFGPQPWHPFLLIPVGAVQLCSGRLPLS